MPGPCVPGRVRPVAATATGWVDLWMVRHPHGHGRTVYQQRCRWSGETTGDALWLTGPGGLRRSMAALSYVRTGDTDWLGVSASKVVDRGHRLQLCRDGRPSCGWRGVHDRAQSSLRTGLSRPSSSRQRCTCRPRSGVPGTSLRTFLLSLWMGLVRRATRPRTALAGDIPRPSPRLVADAAPELPRTCWAPNAIEEERPAAGHIVARQAHATAGSLVRHPPIRRPLSRFGDRGPKE